MKTVVSYSELAAYRQCPLKHRLAYTQRWSKPQEETDPRHTGTLWHQVLEIHYRTIQEAQQRRVVDGKDPRLPAKIGRITLDLAAERVFDLLRDSNPDQTEVEQHVLWMYAGHVQAFSYDPDWVIEGVEEKRILPLPSLTGKGISTRYALKTKIDLIIRTELRSRWVVDHKSARYLPTDNELDIDDQFGLYTWAMNQSGIPVQGAIYSGARTQRTKGDLEGTRPLNLNERFTRRFTFRTDQELLNLAMDAVRTARALSNPDPPFSSPDPRTCKFACDFLEAHLRMRKGIGTPKRIMTNLGFEQLTDYIRPGDQEKDL